MSATMTSRQRLLEVLAHRIPDRVPVAPRVWAWLLAEFGDCSLAVSQRELPEMDDMATVPDDTPGYLFDFPDTYDLPEVRVDVRRYPEGDCQIVERTFHTPAGPLSDRTRISLSAVMKICSRAGSRYFPGS